MLFADEEHSGSEEPGRLRKSLVAGLDELYLALARLRNPGG
jgi:hypothetical protein